MYRYMLLVVELLVAMGYVVLLLLLVLVLLQPIRFKETDDFAHRVLHLMDAQLGKMHTRLRDGTCIPVMGLYIPCITDKPTPLHQCLASLFLLLLLSIYYLLRDLLVAFLSAAVSLARMLLLAAAACLFVMGYLPLSLSLCMCMSDVSLLLDVSLSLFYYCCYPCMPVSCCLYAFHAVSLCISRCCCRRHRF